MKDLKNKDLAELFEIGINFNIVDKIDFIKKINAFDKEKAHELSQMFSIDPIEFGIDLVSNVLQETTISSENELQLPDKIDKYNIIRILGIGGMGIVYLGERSDINQSVAIKVANTLIPQGARIDAITHEAKILASLQHPYIASLVDWGVYDTNRHFVATEYINGHSINRYCQENNLDVIGRIRLFVNVVDAVEYAHGNLVIHRDIKPNNILVEKSGTVKLIDFGVARLLDFESGEQQQTIGVALTPSYASPEQLKGLSLSILTDIYSLGAVLYNLLTDDDFDSSDSTQSLTVKTLEHAMKDQVGESSKLKNNYKLSKQTFADIVVVLSKALSVEVKQRYQNAQSFKEDLTAILEIKPIKARQPSKWYWLKRYIVRNRVTSFILISAMLLTLLAIFFGAYHWHKTIQKNQEILASNQKLKTYSQFLNTTLKGMDAYSGGNPNITMEKFMENSVELYKNETEVPSEQLAWHAVILSSIYESWGHYQQANEILKTGLKYAQISKSPHDNVSLWTEKALIHSNDLNYKLGEKAALQALALIEQYPETEFRKPYAQLALSFSYRESGQLAKAIAITQQIIDNPKRSKLEVAFANYGQAKVQLRQFNLDSTIANINKAMPVYLDRYGEESAQVADSKTLLFWAQIRKNRIKFTQKKRGELIGLYEKVYNLGHTNMALLFDTLADAYFLIGDIDQAIQHQIKAFDILDNSPDAPKTEKILISLHLTRYYLLNNETNAADLIIKNINKTDLKNLANQIQAEYHLIHAQLAIFKSDSSSAKQSLLQTQKFLQNSEFINLVAESNFRGAQIHALDSQWLQCVEQAQIAIQLATQFYPKSWELPQIYKYQQDACQNKLNNISKNNPLELEKLLKSSWGQEIKIINRIIFENK